MRKLRVVFLFLCIAILIIGGCSPRDAAIASLSISENTIKNTYDLDEGFIFDGKKLNISYTNGSQEKIDLQAQHLTGFDTTTTGTKSMVFVHNGAQSAPYEYVVTYKKDPSKKILTNARFQLCDIVYPTGIARSAELNKGSVTQIKAISFTVMASMTIADAEMRTVEFQHLPNGWSCKTLYISPRIFKTVLYQDIGQPIEGAQTKVFHLNLVGVDPTSAVALTNIVISDGNQDYNLPDAEDSCTI